MFLFELDSSLRHLSFWGLYMANVQQLKAVSRHSASLSKNIPHLKPSGSSSHGINPYLIFYPDFLFTDYHILSLVMFSRWLLTRDTVRYCQVDLTVSLFDHRLKENMLTKLTSTAPPPPPSSTTSLSQPHVCLLASGRQSCYTFLD